MKSMKNDKVLFRRLIDGCLSKVVNFILKKKKLYRITYQRLATYTTIIEAKDEVRALKKLRKQFSKYALIPQVLSIEEYKVEQIK